VPAELVSYSGGGDDWFYGDDVFSRSCPDSPGAGPGPGVIGGGVPDELI